MSQRVRDDITRFRDGLRTHLKWYRDNRANAFAGQFIDTEGCQSGQHGVYGMSSWCILSNEYNVDNTEKRLSCLKEMERWVIEGEGENLATDRGPYELRNIISKICYGYSALSMSTEFDSVSTILTNRIVQSALAVDGSWGALVSSNEGDPVFTAMVLRTFEGNPAFPKDALLKAARTIREAAFKLTNPYKKLYVLNTLELLRPKTELSSRRKDIERTLKKLHRSIWNNPISFVNPTIVDFNDVDRTRYYRFASDLIMLESMSIISSNRYDMIMSNVGGALLENMFEVVKTNIPISDTSRHRSSFGNYLYMHRVTQIILKKDEYESSPFTDVVVSKFKTAQMFGIGFSLNFYSMLVLFVIMTITYFFSKPIATVTFGVFLKTLFDLASSLHQSKALESYE